MGLRDSLMPRFKIYCEETTLAWRSLRWLDANLYDMHLPEGELDSAQTVTVVVTYTDLYLLV